MKVIDVVLTVVAVFLLLVVINNLAGCSYNNTIGTQRIYQVEASADNSSTIMMEIPVDASVESKESTTQDTSAEAKATPDTMSTVTGAVGSLLIP